MNSKSFADKPYSKQVPAIKNRETPEEMAEVSKRVLARTFQYRQLCRLS